MQVQINFKNVAVAGVGFFFVCLVYLLWGSDPKMSIPDIAVDLQDLISYSILAVERGGRAVKKVHEEKTLNARSKGKTREGAEEFVTRADLISNQIIQQTFQRFLGVQLISEEKKSLPTKEVEPYAADNYDIWQESKDILKGVPKEKVPLSEIAVWIDPLDATQEFTEDLLEYVTVMACIVVKGTPKFGVIHRPFQEETVWGFAGESPSVYPSDYALPPGTPPNKTVVVSRSHAGPVQPLALGAFGEEYRVEAAGGAGYKTLRVLNGTAQMYLHRTIVKKWDLCAGDAVIRAAGGQMTTLEGNQIYYFPADKNVKNEKGLLVTLRDHFRFLGRLKSALQTAAGGSRSSP